MSNALDRGELTPLLARGHAARCAACQAFGHALVALDDRLARSAHTAPPPPAARRARSPWWVAGPLAVGSAAVIAIVVATSGPAAPVDPPVAKVPSVLVSEALGQIRGLADQVSQTVTTTRTPLDTELDNLIRDGKRGLAAVLETGGLGDAP
ncbi:MAG TPA: hypothetical protein VHT91_09885 [Kofleriaceae bacterium]|nr:hypothetical protein [Kofleriaceae bacterium]